MAKSCAIIIAEIAGILAIIYGGIYGIDRFYESDPVMVGTAYGTNSGGDFQTYTVETRRLHCRFSLDTKDVEIARSELSWWQLSTMQERQGIPGISMNVALPNISHLTVFDDSAKQGIADILTDCHPYLLQISDDPFKQVFIEKFYTDNPFLVL